MYDGRSEKPVEAAAVASFRLARVVKSYQPVHCLADGLIAWRGNTLYRADLELRRFEPICILPIRAGTASTAC